jgi:Uma2 family endonuclease
MPRSARSAHQRQAAENQQSLTLAEFLRFEATATTRHEFVDGFIFAMAGGTIHHNRIGGNIFALAWAKARGSACRVYVADVLVVAPDGKAYYPDVFAVCDQDEEDRGNSRSQTRPCFVVEVLSKTTEVIDRSEKLRNYQCIPTLRRYLLVSQHEALVESYSRLDDESWRYEKIEGTGTVYLPCLELELSLTDIYQDVNFEEIDE